METIDPVRDQEINMPKRDLSLKNLNLNKTRETSSKQQSSPTDLVAIPRIVQAANNYLSTIRGDIKIQAYKVNGAIMVKAILKENGTIIKTIKVEKLLNLNTRIRGMIGLLINEKV